MKRTPGMALWALVLILIFPATSWAESALAKMSADEVNYNYESKQIEAFGNVKIVYKDIQIEADYALLDQELDSLLATGSLTVTNNGNVYHGNKFLYLLRTEQGWIYPLQTAIKDPNIEGTAFMSAAEAFIKGEDVQSKHSTFTTCDLENPHYHLSAKSIEYYPHDVLIMRHVWFYEHSVPVFYLPVLYISLDETKDNFAVQWGRSNTEGFFVDTQYYYYHFPSQNQSGNLEIRLTEYGGNLYAISQSFPVSKTGTFSLKTGLLEKSNMNNPDVSGYSRNDGATYESQYDDYMLGFSSKGDLNSKVSVTQDFTHWFHYTEDGELYPNNTYNLTISGQSPYPSLSMTWKDQYEDTYRTVNLGTHWIVNPDKTSSVNLNGQWYYYGYLDSDSLYLNRYYTLSARKDWTWSNLVFTVSENRNYSSSTSGTSLLPNLIYTIPQITWPVLNNIKIAAQYTNMEKYSSSGLSEGQRYALDFDKASGTIWQQGPFSLMNETLLKYRGFIVNEAETELSSLSTEMVFKDQFTKAFYTKFNVGYAVTAGETCSYFSYDGDDDLPGFYASNSWNYSSDNLTASASTKYNFETQYAYPFNFSLSWKAASIASLAFSTIYYWGEGLGQTDLTAKYNPNVNCNIALGIGYNFLDEQSPWTSKNFIANISGKISSNWSYSIATTYDYLENDFSRAEYNLIYDWHCRQIVLHYDGVEKEYWLQMMIKAFPNDSIKLTGKDTLDNLLNQIESESITNNIR